MTLGEELRTLRTGKRMTLRDVEEGFGVSNGYLSQIETGKVSKPAPDVLLKLAKAYDVPYALLMERAGYILPRQQVKDDDIPAFVFSAAKEFTQSEWDEVQQFFKFLRMKRANQG